MNEAPSFAIPAGLGWWRVFSFGVARWRGW